MNSQTGGDIIRFCEEKFKFKLNYNKLKMRRMSI